jgi:hypothetical protein
MSKKDENLSKLMDSIKDKNDKLFSKINQTHSEIYNKKKCDQKCHEDKLKKKLLDKRRNLLTAPQEVETAYKNFVVFTEGELAYTDQENMQLTEDANAIAHEIMVNFAETTTKIKVELKSYDALLLNYKNVADLYEKYLKENKMLIMKLKNNSTDIITNDRKTYYEDQGINSLNFYYYYILFTVYIIVVLSFGAFAIGYPSQMSYKVKIGIFILLIILPFISTQILRFIIHTLHKIYNMLPKNSYTTI